MRETSPDYAIVWWTYPGQQYVFVHVLVDVSRYVCMGVYGLFAILKPKF